MRAGAGPVGSKHSGPVSWACLGQAERKARKPVPSEMSADTALETECSCLPLTAAHSRPGPLVPPETALPHTLHLVLVARAPPRPSLGLRGISAPLTQLGRRLLSPGLGAQLCPQAPAACAAAHAGQQLSSASPSGHPPPPAALRCTLLPSTRGERQRPAAARRSIFRHNQRTFSPPSHRGHGVPSLSRLHLETMS